MKKFIIATIGIVWATIACAQTPQYGPGAVPQKYGPYLQVALITSDQSVSANTATKCNYNSIVIDTGGWFDAVTNFRYTPLLAGKYLVTVAIRVAATAGAASPILSQVRKNGTTVYTNQLTLANTNSYSDTMTATGIVTMNGSTDFIEGYGQATGSSGTAFSNGAANTWMTITYLGP